MMEQQEQTAEHENYPIGSGMAAEPVNPADVDEMKILRDYAETLQVEHGKRLGELSAAQHRIADLEVALLCAQADAETARAGRDAAIANAESVAQARPFIAAYEAEMISRIDKLTTAIGDVRADDLRKLEHATAYIEVCEARILRFKANAKKRAKPAKKKARRK